MFINKLLLCLCLITFFSFNQADAGLREDLSKKKYDFSEPILDEIRAFKEMLAQPDKSDEIFTLIWEDVCRGNEKIQLKLLQWFSNPNMYKAIQNKVPLLRASDVYSLDSLIQTGISQKKPWAFYEKALRENNPQKKFSLLNQSVNNIVSTNGKFEASIFKERDEIKIDSFSVPIPTFNNNVVKNKKNEIEKFISCCKKNKNGGLLNYLYEYYKKSNEYFAFECLKAACDLGHVGAIISYGNNCHANNDVDGACHWFLKAAEKGNVTAMFNVGTILTNKLKKIDKLEGLKWLLKAAEEGEIDAMYNAGVILRKIGSESVDQIKAFNLFNVASENGQLNAMIALGEMYLDGLEGVGCNSEEAAKCFLSAAEKEDVNGMYLYGVLLKKGFMNQESNINKGNEWILKAAKKGCVAAMNHYGGSLMGWVEDVKEPSTKAAYNWFLKAAKMGDKASMFNVGEMLWWGCGGIKENRQRAKEWLLKSANDGYLDAMIVLATHLLGESYGENLSFKQKKVLLNEAVRLLKIAYDNHYFADLLDFNELKSKKNVLDSVDKDKFRVKFSDRSAFRPKAEDKVIVLINFATLYIQGYVDGQKNIQKSIELILPLAKNNYPEAMDFMGRIFLEGDEGQELDHQKAAQWYKRAAENGFEPSMMKFAKLIIMSPYLIKSDDNLKEALFWLQKAESLGIDEARNYLEMCENLLNENAELEISDNDILEKNDISDHNIIDFKQLNTPIELQEIDVVENNNNNNIIFLSEIENCSINVDFNDENNIIVDDALELVESSNILDENVQQSKNPKYIREQLRKLAELKRKQEDNKNFLNKELSAKNQLIVNMLLDRTIKFKNIDYTQLVNLFADPFFENQVSVIKTKSGCVITAKNYKTLDYFVASTHNKHNKTYDGLNPFFARDLIEILALFGFKVN
ncbi:MAG: hypothetical protein Q8L85_00750 [Alphaproteobacteria bacterium]|nr:hypothetical protein [Alphaproteobacteria bacterium]